LTRWRDEGRVRREDEGRGKGSTSETRLVCGEGGRESQSAHGRGDEGEGERTHIRRRSRPGRPAAGLREGEGGEKVSDRPCIECRHDAVCELSHEKKLESQRRWAVRSSGRCPCGARRRKENEETHSPDRRTARPSRSRLHAESESHTSVPSRTEKEPPSESRRHETQTEKEKREGGGRTSSRRRAVRVSLTDRGVARLGLLAAVSTAVSALLAAVAAAVAALAAVGLLTAVAALAAAVATLAAVCERTDPRGGARSAGPLSTSRRLARGERKREEDAQPPWPPYPPPP